MKFDLERILAQEGGDDDYDPFDDGTSVDASSLTPAPSYRNDILKLKRGRSTRVKRADLESKTRELYRNAGYTYDKAEHYGYSGNRSDLFGFVDGVAAGNGEIVFIQTCRKKDRAAHLRKMATGGFKLGNGSPTDCYPAAKAICECLGTHLVLVMWDQPEGPGTRWRHEIEEVTAETLDGYRARLRFGAANATEGGPRPHLRKPITNAQRDAAKRQKKAVKDALRKAAKHGPA
jgi:hypothetical protein